jgi:hypothetical protein
LIPIKVIEGAFTEPQKRAMVHRQVGRMMRFWAEPGAVADGGPQRFLGFDRSLVAPAAC